MIYTLYKPYGKNKNFKKLQKLQKKKQLKNNFLKL